MNGYNINQEPADKLDVTQKVNQYIASGVQPTIPQNISDRLLAAHAKRLENTMYSLPANGVDGEDTNADELRADMNTIEARHGRVRRMGVFASGRIDGIKARQRQIAEQIASTTVYSTEHASGKSAPTAAPVSTVPLEKINQRLKDLEQIATDINQNIAHIDAVVSIKDNYLHQLRTAEGLLARYKAAEESGDDEQMDQAEIFHAAYTVIMHNVPRRYNPEATNAKGHETIAQVIARLEDEVAELNSKAAEGGFEVGLEQNILEAVKGKGKITQDSLLEMLDRYINGYRSHFAPTDFPFDETKLAEIKAKTLYKLGKILLNVNNAAVQTKYKPITRRTLPEIR